MFVPCLKNQCHILILDDAIFLYFFFFFWQCSSLSELLSAFGLSNASAVSLNDLEMMCPAILNQVLLPACPYTSPSNHNDSSLLPDYKGEYDYHKCFRLGGSDNQMCCMEPGKCILSNEEIGRDYNKSSGNHINLFYQGVTD